MAESVMLVSEPRTVRGSSAARKLRRQGFIPAVVYGHKEETLSVTLPADALQKAVKQGVHVVDLQAGGKTEKALIREVQWDYLGKDIVHVDFARVAADERIRVTVRLEMRGTAPGIAAGGVLDQPLHSLEIECLAISIPDTIRVNVSELQIGQVIHVRELVMPEGVKALADPDVIVVHVAAKVVEAEPAPAVVAAPGAAEPEIIGRKVAAEEEEAE